jgi:hypothetical protein
VTRRLEEALLDLHEVAPPERRQVIDEQLALLQVSVTEATFDSHDVQIALVPDRQGFGVGAPKGQPG